MARSSFSKRVLVAFFVVALIFILHSVGLLGFVERGILGVTRPLQNVFASVNFRHQPANNVPGQVELLQQQVARLVIENVRLKEEKSHDQAVANQQGFLAQHGLHGVDASVIGQTPEGDEQVLVLDRGKEKGIEPGQPVIADDGLLVGTILTSQPGRSTVLLVTNTQSTIAAEVVNAAHSNGIVHGQHGLTMRMQFIPQDEKIQKTDIVVTSAVDEKIPAGLVIGEIAEIHYSTGDLFQEASIRSLVDLQRIRLTTVVQR